MRSCRRAWVFFIVQKFGIVRYAGEPQQTSILPFVHQVVMPWTIDIDNVAEPSGKSGGGWGG